MSASFIEHRFGLQVLLVVRSSEFLVCPDTDSLPQLAAVSLSAGCLALSFAPPFGAFISAIVFQGFGCGLYDASLTTVISHKEDGVAMSLMYAAFGVGASIAPLIIGAFVDRGIAWNVSAAGSLTVRND